MLMSWTDDRIEDLKRRWAAEETCSEIGSAMGVSRCAVIGKVHRLGLSGRKRSTDPLARERAKQKDAARNIANRKISRQRMREQVMEEQVAAMPVFAGSLNIPFADLRDFSNERANQCRFIADEPPGPLYRACGTETRPGESYCPHCRQTTLSKSTLSQPERALFIRMGVRKHLRALREAV